MPMRVVRVVRNEMQLRYRADCPYCHRVAYFLNDEALYYRGDGPRPWAGSVPRSVLHACTKLDTTKQLIHNGRKP